MPVSKPAEVGSVRPLAVTVVFPAAARGGAEIWQERLLDATDRIDVRVIALQDGDTAQRWRDRGVPVTVIPTGKRPTDLLKPAWLLSRNLLISRPDVLVAHGVKAGLVAAAAGLLTGTRTVWVRHDDSFPREAQLLDRLTDGQIRTSGRLWGAQMPSNPLELQPVAAGTPADRATATAELALGDDPGRRLVMANRLAPYKGVDDAIRALSESAATGWRLHVYGVDDPTYPDERRRLDRLAAELGVTDRVSFRAPHDDIGRLFAAYDAVAVLTKSLPDENVSSESFSMTAMEAQLAGVPVISVPPVSDRIGAGGIAVDPAAPAEVATALGRIAAGFPVRPLPTSAAESDAANGAQRFAGYLAELTHRPGAGMAGDQPISVVTTALNDAGPLPDLIDRITAQLGPDDEWCFVDGGSTDGTVDLIRAAADRDPRISVIVQAGVGISAGRNIGIAAARNDLIACTDVGCEPVAGWLAAFRTAAAERPEAGLLTGTYQVTAHNIWQRAMSACGYPQVTELAHPTLLVRGYGKLLGRSFDATMPTGRSMAFTREAWKRAGGFPEHLATGEDVLYGRAIAEQLPAMLVRDAEVAWHQRPTVRSTLRMYKSYGRGSGESRNPRLLGRDMARAGSYLVGAAVAAKGSRTARVATAAGFLATLSLPLVRAARMEQPIQVVAMTPVMSALRDLAKAYGALAGLADGEP